MLQVSEQDFVRDRIWIIINYAVFSFPLFSWQKPIWNHCSLKLMSIATTTKRIEGNVTRDDLQRFLAVGTMLWVLEEMSKQYCNAVSGCVTLKCTLWIIPCNSAFTNLQPRFLGQQCWNNMLEQFETLLSGSVALKIVVVGMSRVTLIKVLQYVHYLMR